MIKKILSISGKSGLFKLVNRGKNMLIVESLATGKRQPAYAKDKVVSLGDIAIYTTDEDMPLAQVLEKVKAANSGNSVDVKALGDDKAVREYFATILPEYDQERVYTTDIRKLLNWYNQLLEAGITEFEEKEESPEGTKATPQADKATPEAAKLQDEAK